MPFQDVAKAGLKFGDEGEIGFFFRFYSLSHICIDLDPEEEKERLKETKEKFKPLIMWLKGQASDVVRDGKQPYSMDLYAL